ncbi:DNA repair protein REV1 isoform X1 [Phycodurus eques]|uniref:DNA repair protein REV1 isoform X1 n=2 Tax=Phycodurus eques TaxID=693459 RepID=UPI002ACE5955|nr:DNA repair protein REV1 isoform X1 [Phycodurus eques]XP_061548505.1 DNA repair protein REV1 isoform X1 [Phycodurus eques]
MSRDVWTKKRANASGDNGWAERGGYMAAKVSKLEEQFKSDAPREKQKDGSSSIFTGVAIYVNGYTEPSADELRRLMLLHGGQFHVYYSRSKTTHIIAHNLPNCKIQELKGEKVIKPGWITDSIKAGRLLPYLHYQLYAKYKAPLFPAMKPRQTSEIAGASDSLHSIPNQETSNSSYPAHKLQGSLQKTPSSHPHHRTPSASSHPDPEHSHFSVQPRHCSSSNSHNPLFKSSPLKHPQSGLLSPYALQSQRADQPEPQTSCSTHQRRHKEVEIRVNGSMQTSAAALIPECIKAPTPLTNGHAHLVNGALKSKDLVLDKVCVPKDLSECRIASSERKDTYPNKLDPYEFPNSPPKQSDLLPVCPEDSYSKDALNSPQQTSLQVNSNPDNIPHSPPSHPHVPVRLNGSHHNAFSSHPASESNSTVRPHPSTAPSESAARLSAQTGGLISEYYAHSRLHQISTWRTGFSEYVNELHNKRKATGVASLPGKERLRKLVAQGAFESQDTPASFAVKSCILHVDMDCFFVSVGIRHRPALKDKPVAVTSNRGHVRVPLRPGANPQLEQQYYQRKHALAPPAKEFAYLHDAAPQERAEVHANGVDQGAALSMAEIASCSYAARQAGVKNGMFFGKAKQLCPTLQSVPYDFDAYKEVALTMYETLASYTHDIEALSCDEVLLDASALIAELGVDPEDLAKAIRADIKEKTGCCASIGMGSNILLARLSTRKAKPDGQYFLKSEEVDDFIRDLLVTSLPGVGPVMGRKLAAIGVKSCGDLRQVSLTQLQKKFGPRSGQTLFRFCRGLDDRPVRYEKERKSVSAEMNYNIRFKKVDEAESFLSNLSMEVQQRLQEAGLQGRRVTLKVMVRKDGAPQETAKYGGHGICDNFAKTVMLAQSTDSGQLIAATVIKMFHAMKLPVQELRGLGIQVQLLEGSHSAHNNANGLRTRSIKEMLLGHTSNSKDAGDNNKHQEKTPRIRAMSPGSIEEPQSPNVSVPGTSKEHEACRQMPKTPRTILDFSIEIPSPSQVDRSVLEALPAELRLQVEQSWTCREGRQTNRHRPASPQSSSPKSRPVSPPCPPPPLNKQPAPPGALVLQISNQPDSPGIVLELPNYSQVDPDVFAALPKELQEELKSAYNRAANNQPQTKMLEQKNALLQLKQSVGVGRLKRRYKRKNAVSPAKKGPSPQKKYRPMNSPAKIAPPFTKLKEPKNVLKAENDPSTSSSKQDMPELLPKCPLRPSPALAGASELPDIKTLLREWVTTMTDPMEEDILQVVKYCTDLIEDKDLEKLDLIIKYMKRIMQQSLESVWSMAFDFILDNVQVVVQQTYGSTLKIT